MNCDKGMVNVYDLLFKVLDEEAVDTIDNYFKIESKKAQGNVQIQERSKDREVFTIAFLTYLPCV